MDVAIEVAINIVNSLTTLISDLRHTPSLVQRIDTQVRQLSSRLQTLHEKSKAHVLTKNETAVWAENQQICNDLLRRTRDILWVYARDTRSKPQILSGIIFQLGPKDDIIELHADLEKSVEYFQRLAEIILPSSALVSSLGGAGILRGADVTTLGQFAQMSYGLETKEKTEEPQPSELE